MRISRRPLSLIAGSFFVVGLVAGVAGGCGSSGSNSGNFTALCMQYCNKCFASSGAAILQACTSSCISQGMQMSTCTNASAIGAAAQTCLNMSTCDESNTCFETNIPACQGGATGGSTGATGSGGSTGTGAAGHAGATGGTTGTGTAGTGGTAVDCSICDKAVACCTAILGASSCTGYSSAMCTAAGDQAAAYASGCQQVLTSGAAIGNAACQ